MRKKPSSSRYILANPVRASLVVDFRDYPFSGSTRYTMADLVDAMQIAGLKPCATSRDGFRRAEALRHFLSGICHKS
jgi:hypothetical protein